VHAIVFCFGCGASRKWDMMSCCQTLQRADKPTGTCGPRTCSPCRAVPQDSDEDLVSPETPEVFAAHMRAAACARRYEEEALRREELEERLLRVTERIDEGADPSAEQRLREAEEEAQRLRRKEEESYQERWALVQQQDEERRVLHNQMLEREEEANRKRVSDFLSARHFRGPNAKRSRWTRFSYPLHAAVDERNVEMITLLLNARADPALENSSRQTPLKYATAISRNHRYSGEMVEVIRALS